MGCDGPMNLTKVRDRVEDLRDQDGANGVGDGRDGHLHLLRHAIGGGTRVKKSAKGAKEWGECDPCTSSALLSGPRRAACK